MDLANGAQDANIQIQRAHYYLEQNVVDEARAAADVAIRLESRNPVAWLARAYAHHRLDQHENARADVRRARDLGAKDPLIDHLLEADAGASGPAADG